MDAHSGRAGGHYQALGVTVDAPARAIEQAFLGWQERRRKGAAGDEEFFRAEQAYRVLADPALRARHDREIAWDSHPAWAASRASRARSCLRHGMVLSARGRLEEAIALLERAVRLNPGDPESRSALALLLARSGRRLHEAAGHAEIAVRCRPGEASCLFALAEVYRAAGLGQRALRARGMAWRALVGGLFRRRRPV